MKTARPKVSKKPEISPMCRAEGCPNRWTVNAPDKSRLCTAHAWVSPNLWPLITNEQLSRVGQTS